jgi:hypothetical protein
MDRYETAPPMGERVAALETALPDVVRRLDEANAKLDRAAGDLAALKSAVERRTGAERVAAWFVDLLKLGAAAALGAGAQQFFGGYRH